MQVLALLSVLNFNVRVDSGRATEHCTALLECNECLFGILLLRRLDVGLTLIYADIYLTELMYCLGSVSLTHTPAALQRTP